MTTARAHDPWTGVDPFDPAVRDDPYPFFARLREIDPVNETPIGIWRLTRYADVDRLLHEVPAGVRTTTGQLVGVDEAQVGPRLFMLQQDPPTHTRLRKLVSHGFTPRAVSGWRLDIERVVDECLTRTTTSPSGAAPTTAWGAPLARTEAQIAIGELVRRFDDLALESDAVEWGPSLFRVPGRLPITFRARKARAS